MLIIGEILIVSDSEVFKAWKEACANKRSSKLAEFFTEDFRFVSRQRDISKQETLDWTDEGAMALFGEAMAKISPDEKKKKGSKK